MPPIRARSARAALAAVALSGLLLVSAPPARATGVADLAMTLMQADVLITTALNILGPSLTGAFTDFFTGTASSSDTSLSGGLSGQARGQSFSIVLGGAGSSGDLSASGTGSVGLDPIFYSGAFTGLTATNAFQIATETVQVGSNTTTLMLTGQTVSILPGVVSTLAASVDIDGAVTPFTIDVRFDDATPGSIDFTAVVSLGEGLTVDVVQDGDSWAATVSSVPEPSPGLLLAGGLAVLAWHRRRR